MSWTLAQIKTALQRIETKLDELIETNKEIEKPVLTPAERMAKARQAKQAKRLGGQE